MLPLITILITFSKWQWGGWISSSDEWITLLIYPLWLSWCIFCLSLFPPPTLFPKPHVFQHRILSAFFLALSLFFVKSMEITAFRHVMVINISLASGERKRETRLVNWQRCWIEVAKKKKKKSERETKKKKLEKRSEAQQTPLAEGTPWKHGLHGIHLGCGSGFKTQQASAWKRCWARGSSILFMISQACNSLHILYGVWSAQLPPKLAQIP